MKSCKHRLLLLIFFKHFNYLQTNSETDSAVLLQSILCIVGSLQMLFVACEVGQRSSNEFNGIYDSICQLEWHLYPIEVQKMFVLIMMYTQEPLEIAFFGSSTCSRDQFKKVQFDGRRFCLRIENDIN